MAASTTLTRHAGSLISVGFILLFLLFASFVVGGCAAQRQLSPKPGRHDVVGILTKPAGPFAAAPDPIAPPLGYEARGKVRTKAERQKARELRRWHRQFQAAAERVKTGQAIPKKCKGCVFNVVAGDQTNSTAGKKAIVAAGDGASTVVAGKKAGPIVQADSGASVQVATAKDQAAAGQGISLQHVETKKTLAATLLPWVAGIGGVALVGWLLFGGGGALLLALWRRNTSSNTQA